jgi:poly(A) polymerase
VRCIGDPNARFQEDPVRMLRALVFAARLDFVVDAPVLDAIARHKLYIEHAAPARVLEEFYKILRSGYAARTFAAMSDAGLLRHIAPEFPADPPRRLIEALERLDSYRTLTADVSANLTTAVLLATLLVPLGMMSVRPRRGRDEDEGVAPRGPSLGRLPLARKDLERIGHLLTMQSRLAEMEMHPRRQRGMVLRPSFTDALTWMDIHGDAPDVVEHWQQVIIGQSADEERPLEEHLPGVPSAAAGLDGRPARRRRRGRRR